MFVNTLDIISLALIAAVLIACWLWYRWQAKLYREDRDE